MKKPPPSRLNQQEPPYQSPPRPPPPQQEPYQTQPPPLLHQQEPSQTPRSRDTPSASTAPPSSSSPYTSAVPNSTSAAFDDSLLWAESSSTFSPQDLEFLYFLLSSPSMQPTTSYIPHCDGGPLKRHRFDLGHDMHSYLPRDEGRGIPHSSEEIGRFNGLGGMGRPGGDNMYMGGELMTGRGANDTRAIGFGQQDLAGWPSRELLPLPPVASSTLFVEGLPSNCSMREVAHIFRPFLGYKEVRLVTKDSKHRNGDPIVLCFVDFENPACAATARNALARLYNG